MSEPPNAEPPAGERCVRCGHVDHDRRTLWMACFYAMDELPIPFVKVEIPIDSADPKKGARNYFTLRVCKDCRGSWMHAIERWFLDADATDGALPDGRNIPYREHGRTVMLTRDEWDRRQHRPSAIESIRVTHDKLIEAFGEDDPRTRLVARARGLVVGE